MHARHLLAVAALSMASLAAHAHEFRIADIRIGHPYARATVPGQMAGGAYVTLENNGKTADRLIGASVAATAAERTEIHTMAMEGSVMKMREVKDIALPPGARVAMKPGDGFHFMLMGLKAPLKEGDKLPMTLSFEKAGKVEVMIHVEGRSGAQHQHGGAAAPKASAHAHGEHRH